PIEIAPAVAFLDEAVSGRQQLRLELGVARKLVARECQHDRVLDALPIRPERERTAPTLDGAAAGTGRGELRLAVDRDTLGAQRRREDLGEDVGQLAQGPDAHGRHAVAPRDRGCEHIGEAAILALELAHRAIVRGGLRGHGPDALPSKDAFSRRRRAWWSQRA